MQKVLTDNAPGINSGINGSAMFRFPFLTVVVVGAILWGWAWRDEYWIRAEDGLGYVLGIIGASMMILLLVYPLSKKVRFLRSLLPPRYWFKGHMLLGICGPLLILFHCNFRLGSANSTVALFSMLLVVLSGLVGRYIYRHTHNGLYGRKLDYQELLAQQKVLTEKLRGSRLMNETLATMIDEIEQLPNLQPHSIIGSYRTILVFRKKSRHLSKALAELAVQHENGLLADFRDNLNAELKILRSMVGLSFYERLFSIWHVVHLPFFFMLIITAVVHVFAVHWY